MNLSLQLLQTHRHDRGSFDCGLQPVNSFLREQARRQMEQRINRTWVLTRSDLPDEALQPILGYFTLTQGTVHRAELPTDIALSSFPMYPLPVVKLAWLGVAVAHQRSELRVGELLLLEALHSARYIVEQTGFGIAVVTDPLTEASEQFFRKYGFTGMNRRFGERDRLFLGLKTLKELSGTLTG